MGAGENRRIGLVEGLKAGLWPKADKADLAEETSEGQEGFPSDAPCWDIREIQL